MKQSEIKRSFLLILSWNKQRKNTAFCNLLALPLGSSLLTNVPSHQPPLTSDLPLTAGRSILNFLSTSADLWLEGSHWLSSPGKRGLLSLRPFSSMQTFSFLTSSRAESVRDNNQWTVRRDEATTNQRLGNNSSEEIIRINGLSGKTDIQLWVLCRALKACDTLLFTWSVYDENMRRPNTEPCGTPRPRSSLILTTDGWI